MNHSQPDLARGSAARNDIRSPSPSTSASSFAIVVGLDFTDAGYYAFDQAVRLARKTPGASIQLVHVDPKPLDAKRKTELVEHLRLYANEKAESLGGLSGITVGIHLRSGDTARELAQLASDVGASLIVVGAHHSSHVKSWIVGTVAEKLNKSAPCAVVVVGPRPKEEPLEPAIEPPCPDCVNARFASRGAQFWCARHAEHHRHAHTFSYERELPFAGPDFNDFGR